ncbi:CHAT domain-containing protein [Sphaerotilus microaerophilus]|nr:CHAT domain-containing protein [Sphaerotilus sp. FB-5]
MVAMLDILASGFEFASGRPNSSLARTTVLLGRAGYSGRAPDQVTVKTLFLRWSAAFELERWQDVHETSADYWIFLSLRNPYSTSHAESMMMLAMDAKVYGKSSAAIFLGKAAVNAIQEKRAGITELQADIQKSFLKKYSKMYQFVANVLIERGRVIEAEQVLQMLKELELRELTPRSKVGSSVQLTRVDLGGAEQRAYAQMESLVTEGARLQSELARIRIRIELLQGDEAENRQRVTELEAKLQAWEAAMRAFLDNLPKELPEVQAAGGEQENEKAKGRLQAVVQRDPTAVGLQFVVTEERLGILMASREGTVGRFSPITRVELSQRVSQLRTAILNKADTREAAEALWKALLGPVEADLQRLGARTLLLASTDVLRYLPFAALQDEQGHYLIERFALANWLAAAPDPKPRVQTQPWRMAALGVTQAKPGFPALPGVRREIQGIVRSPINPGGALPGYAHLDDEFDLQHLDEAIGGAGNIVHVASHFDFRPGDERRSVLVVGRGDPVSMASLARRDFSKVEQLTLSACETATGGGFNETGAEVEGLAALLLVKQARSVMGTLWKVADASTAQLMVSYYRQMQSGLAGQAGPLPGRAAALRAAQLQLLKGQGASVTDKLARGARPLAAGTPSPSAPSPGNPWAHPYYWAPFVISGDWM